MSQEPLVSIVTPCLNAAAVIRDAVESVVQTSTIPFEHIIVDGGSTDGTREILEEYDHLELVFEPDSGPYEALNNGFKRSSGGLLAWLNADDFYLPGTLDTVVEIFKNFSQIDWLTTAYPEFATSSGRIAGTTHISGYSRSRALHPDSLRFTDALHAVLQQESTFWSRRLWERCGSRLDTRYNYAADFELWLRFWQHTEVYAANVPLGCFRWTDDQRSRMFETEYRSEVDEILGAYGGSRANLFRTFGRRASLLLRGLPQGILQYCPWVVEQKTVSYHRDPARWELSKCFSIPG